MAIGERFRSGGTHGVAKFLADHQGCDAGFDVRREDQPGSGKLKITCEGCGQSVSYRAADAVDLAAGTLGVPQGANGTGSAVASEAPAAKGPPPSPLRRPPRADPLSSPPAPPPARRPAGPLFPGWLPAALIGGLILGGIAMMAIGLTRSGDGDEGSEPQATQETPATEPAEVPPSEQPQGAEAPAETPAAEPPAEQAAEVRLDRTRIAGIFAIGVPKGWQREDAGDGGVSIHTPDNSVEIRIFFEPGERSNGELASAAAGFLADEHRAARISKPETIRIDHSRAARIEATYPGGEEEAIVLSKGGYAFLLLCRSDRSAEERLHDRADAVMSSFDAER